MKGLLPIAVVSLAALTAVGLTYQKSATADLPLSTHGPNRKDKVTHTDAEWKKLLTKKQYDILRGHGTEAAFCSPLLENHGNGIFYCAACNLPLFSTNAKFNSGTGWPSFFQPVKKENVWYKRDTSFNMVRIEVNCARCDSHLGHVFDDGPTDKGGRRFCMNGEALSFKQTPAPKKK